MADWIHWNLLASPSSSRDHKMSISLHKKVPWLQILAASAPADDAPSAFQPCWSSQEENSKHLQSGTEEFGPWVCVFVCNGPMGTFRRRVLSLNLVNSGWNVLPFGQTKKESSKGSHLKHPQQPISFNGNSMMLYLLDRCSYSWRMDHHYYTITMTWFISFSCYSSLWFYDHYIQTPIS